MRPGSRSALILLFCGILPAQVVPPDGEEQRRRSREEAEERQRLREAPTVHLQEALGPGEEDEGFSLPEESPRFPIRRIVLEGPLPPALRFIVKDLERYQGRSMGARGIRLILRRITRRILDRGFTTTRLDLPGQDLGGGTLTLRLVPGVIRAIRCTDPALGDAWRWALPARPGDLLNIRDLEQGLEQMKRLTSLEVTLALTPGAGPGESDLVLRVKRGRSWLGAVSLEDSGSAATGKWQGHLHGDWENPLGRCDQFSAAFSHDITAHAKGRGTQDIRLAYTLPVGYWTFHTGWNRHGHVQRLEGTQGDLPLIGKATDLDFRAGYLVFRNQTRKETLQVRVGHHASRTFLDATEIEVHRRRSTFLELSAIHEQHLGWGRLDLAASHRQGVSWFGALSDLPGTGPGDPTFFYRLHTLDATVTIPFAPGGRPMQYRAALHGQRASTPLYASEYLTLGNRWTVRGFDGEHTLASEHGGFLRQDLECTLGQGTTLYLGLDAGRVGGAHAGHLPGRSLAGAVLGLRGALTNSLSCHFFVGGPLRQPAAFRNPWPVLGFQARCQF